MIKRLNWILLVVTVVVHLLIMIWCLRMIWGRISRRLRLATVLASIASIRIPHESPLLIGIYLDLSGKAIVEGQTLWLLRQTSIVCIILSSRTKFFSILVLMALSPFMAVAMNGAVIIIGELLVLLLFILFSIIWCMLSSPFAWILLEPVEGYLAWLFIAIRVSLFTVMGIRLRFLLYHVGTQGFNSCSLETLSGVDEICTRSCGHQMIK